MGQRKRPPHEGIQGSKKGEDHNWGKYFSSRSVAQSHQIVYIKGKEKREGEKAPGQSRRRITAFGLL